MAQELGFSIGKLASYSTSEIHDHMSSFQTRAEKLNTLKYQYNDKSGEALSGRGNSSQQLAAAQYWSNLCDVASEMATEAQKKAIACQVELHLRS